MLYSGKMSGSTSWTRLISFHHTQKTHAVTRMLWLMQLFVTRASRLLSDCAARHYLSVLPIGTSRHERESGLDEDDLLQMIFDFVETRRYDQPN